MKSKITVCFCVVAVALIHGAFEVSAASKVDKISITYVKLPLNVPAMVAKRLGLFEKEFGPDGIAIERPELTAGPKQTEAMAAGSVQFASVLSSDSAILARANGVDLKVISVFSRAPKAFNVMTRNPAIKGVADLKDKTVAGLKGSLLNQLLFAALKKEGLRPADVKYVNMAGVQAQAALLSSSVDAALIAGPAQIKAEAGGARVLANGEGLVKGLILTAVSGQFLKNHPDLVKRYLNVHEQALEYLKTRPDEAIRLVAEETEIGEADVRRMLPWYDFDPKITDSDLADMKATQAFLQENEMLTNTIDMKDLIAVIR